VSEDEDSRVGFLSMEGRIVTKASRHLDKLSKFLAYVLGRRPDEFGLVPDAQGFVGLKELLQVLHEESGWRHIRHGQLQEVYMITAPAVIEIEGSRIRAVDRLQLPAPDRLDAPPKLLFIAIRRRAYPVVLEKGLTPPAHRPYLILSALPEMAVRMARRLDNDPILLNIHAGDAIQAGTSFERYGRHLYLADKVGVGAFSGPPVPKDKAGAKTSPPPPESGLSKTPGSYFPDLAAPLTAKPHPPAASRRKEPDWKKTRRQARKYKERQR
jgi:putative RNA 2'-phosphotransferase